MEEGDTAEGTSGAETGCAMDGEAESGNELGEVEDVSILKRAETPPLQARGGLVEDELLCAQHQPHLCI